MKISLPSKVAIGSFIVAGMGILIVSFLSYNLMVEYFKNNILDNLEFELTQDTKKIKENIDRVHYDAQLLTNDDNLKAFYRAYNNKYHYDAQTNMTLDDIQNMLQKNFLSLLSHNTAYFNVRLIHRSGQELIVAIKNQSGTLYIKEAQELQNKAQRSYFQSAIKLKPHNVFISKINLNREYGKIEIPHLPTIRIAIPIYFQHKIFAILIINANIYTLFDPLKDIQDKNKHIFLANENGYYLYNRDETKTFGFDLHTSYKITDDFNLKKEKYFQNKYAFAYTKIYVTSNRYLILALTMTDKFLQQQSQDYQRKLFIYMLIVSFIIALILLILVRFLISPLVKLTQKAENIAHSQDDTIVNFQAIQTNDEIGELSKSLQIMIEKLNKSKQEVEQKVQERTEELHQLNENLEKLVNKKTKENIAQFDLLQQQSKLASMGEMIGAIAHQWRQPLNELSITIQNLKYDYEDGIVDEHYVNTFISSSKKIIMFMSHTIDDFRNFYRTDKTKETFDVKEAIQKTVFLQQAQLLNNNIEVSIIGESFTLTSYKNELQQVILNLINNAKDALVENKITNGKIIIELANNSIAIKDNAGGIDANIIDRIFEPYFTTKEEGKGTGMGLYMAKIIIEKNIKAKLSVANIQDGAVFRIDFNDN